MKNKLFNSLARIGRNTQGQTIVESLICSIIIMIILVGLLQLFQLYVAKLLTNYSAYRAARTYCVGFRDDDQLDLVGRSARVAAIGASGKLVEPNNMTFDDPVSQFSAEKIMIPEYISGTKWWLEYEYWSSNTSSKDTYETKFKDADGKEYLIFEKSQPGTYLTSSWNPDTGIAKVAFKHYPFPFFDLFDPNRTIFRTKDEEFEEIDISGSSTITNYASSYLVLEQ